MQTRIVRGIAPTIQRELVLRRSGLRMRRILMPLAALLLLAGQVRAAGSVGKAPSLSLQQVLDRGLKQSLDLQRDDRLIARDRALVDLAATAPLPRLDLLGLGSFTQVGTSVGLVTNLPTLGDLNLSLGQNGYALLQNTFGNLGLVLDVNLLPLRQRAEVAAGRSVLAASTAARSESERQVRFTLISTYRTLQLHQALVPVWEEALKASSALERDAIAIRSRGLAARIDVLRARMLRASDAQGLSQEQAQLSNSRQQLAALLGLPPNEAPLAADPIQPQPLWPLGLEDTIALALCDRPLLESLRLQQQAQSHQARGARLSLLPSLSLLVGGGIAGDQLANPVFNQGGTLSASAGSLALPSQQQNGSVSGSF